jgi:universal stress protein A
MTAKAFEAHGARSPADQPPTRIKKILVAVDFSPSSKNAFRHAMALANHFCAQLSVLHVVPSAALVAFGPVRGIPQFRPDDLTKGEENLLALVDSGELNTNKARPLLRLGLPAHEICEAAKEDDVDLLVLGTHGSTAWKHFCIGSTAERVARAAPCPVLVVREKEHDFC